MLENDFGVELWGQVRKLMERTGSEEGGHRLGCEHISLANSGPNGASRYPETAYPERRGTSFRGETYWQVRRSGIGVRGGEDAEERGEVRLEFARSDTPCRF